MYICYKSWMEWSEKAAACGKPLAIKKVMP